MWLFNGFMQHCTQRNYTITAEQFTSMVSSPLMPPNMQHYLSNYV